MIIFNPSSCLIKMVNILNDGVLSCIEAIAGVHVSHKTAGILSTIFDIGGVVGGILAGFISDLIEAQAVSSFIFLLLSIPALIEFMEVCLCS